MKPFTNFAIPFGFTVFLLCRAASAEILYDRDGIQLQGTAQIVSRYAATCHVLEEKHSPLEFRRIKDNHGQSLHVWQLDFSAHNNTGHRLSSLKAEFDIASPWPPCTEWSGEGPGGGPSGNFVDAEGRPTPIEWADTQIALSMPNGMGKDQVARDVLFLLVFHEDQPAFRSWSVDFSLDVPGKKEQPAPDAPQSGAGPRGADPRRGLQLPPEILVDKHVSQAQRLLREEDPHGARQAMEKALSLQQEHELEPQPEDHFGYAEVWFGLGEPERAIQSLARYLQLRGRDADRYQEALDLLNRAEAEKARDEAAAYSAAQSGPLKIRAGETVMFDGMEFVGIPPGEFLMGSTGSYAEPDERPVTQVWISRGFFLGKYEVTQDQWKAVMGHNPSRFSGCGNCPVEKVSWNNVQAFIRKLNARAEGGRYRLPTEAEWEYAARAGTTTDTYAGVFSLGGDAFEEPVVHEIAWHYRDSGRQTQPVGQKVPNSFGLYDMLGNVWEWVSDWYSRYPGGAVTDPVGPRTGRGRVAKGGSWSDLSTKYFRASYRRVFQPRHRGEELGFRLVRTE